MLTLDTFFLSPQILTLQDKYTNYTVVPLSERKFNPYSKIKRPVTRRIIIYPQNPKQRLDYLNDCNVNSQGCEGKYSNYQELFFKKYHLPFWFKINFRGKGFRVRKFRKVQKITFNFGLSHWSKIKFINKKYRLVKIRRQNYLAFVQSWKTFHYLRLQIKVVKSINRYTKRGLRLKKQLIIKRFGKISQVVSSLQM